MKNYVLLVIAGTLLVLLAAACSNSQKSKLKGDWRSKDGATKLKITNKNFITEDGTTISEDYFLKGDTIFTSFQGNQPYTRFAVQKLDDHSLILLGPDSVAVEYRR